MDSDDRQILVCTLLKVRSSYLQNLETPVAVGGDAAGEAEAGANSAPDSVPDTVQFCILPDIIWRIRTYAIDHDVHVLSLARRTDDAEYEAELCALHIMEQYGDLMGDTYLLEVPDFEDTEAVSIQLLAQELPGRIDLAGEGTPFGFYNPDNEEYVTKSQFKM